MVRDTQTRPERPLSTAGNTPAHRANLPRQTFLAVLVLSAFTLISAVLVGPPEPSLTTVRVAAGLPFLNRDPEVAKILRDSGLTVEYHGYDLARSDIDPTRYDLTVAGGKTASLRVTGQLPADARPRAQSWFTSRMAILTRTRVLEALESIGVAVAQGDGTWRFDVAAYLEQVRARKRWTDIAGPSGYRNGNRLLLNTTDPRQSNSGAMFAAIASYTLNGRDGVVTDAAQVRRVLPALRPCFADQGLKAPSTQALISDFLVKGEDAVPMALVYENDAIDVLRNSGRVGGASDVQVMYPGPNVYSDNVLISLTPAGHRLAAELRDNAPLRELLTREYGYRNTDPARFVELMRRQGVTVPRVPEPVPEPEAPIMQMLLDGI